MAGAKTKRVPQKIVSNTMSVAEAAQVLRWTYRRTYEWMLAGKLSGKKVGHTYRVTRQSVDDLYNEYYGIGGGDDAATPDATKR